MIQPRKAIPIAIVFSAFACTFLMLSFHPSGDEGENKASQKPFNSKKRTLSRPGSSLTGWNDRASNPKSSSQTKARGPVVRSSATNAQQAFPSSPKSGRQNNKAALRNLDIPDICTADLPGLDFHDHQQALHAVSQEIRQQLSAADHPPRLPSFGNQSFDPVTRSESASFPDPRITRADDDSPPEIQELKRLLVKPVPASRVSYDSPAQNSSAQNMAGTLTNYNPHQNASRAQNSAYRRAASNPDVDPHAKVFSQTAFPSATECKSCHEQIYQEWSVSGHAYAAVSPMFHKFEQKINDLSQGTIGYFCMRCHAPVATTMELPRDQPIWCGPRVFREGVTCVACHRVIQAHGKDNGERRIEPGPIEAPIVGSSDGIGVEFAKKHRDFFKVKTDPQDKKPGQLIHRRVIQFDQLSKSTFCVSCHQVAVEPGIALEVVWNQYRASPAWLEGITCQDCHMGRVPGMAEGYSIGPVAVIEGKQVSPDRKHSNHQFYGPGYSIAHPGVFPQNPEADKWTFTEWLQFDWRSGWGTEEFERALQNGQTTDFFPPVWSEPDDRMDAREIIDANLKLLGYKRDLRRQVMENGAKLEGPYFAREPERGRPLQFHYLVRNINTGHNMPSGSLGAQPQLWLNVVLIGPQGNRIWESGYLDTIGDLADRHSEDVLTGKVPFDRQLFNLQTKFLTTNVKGTDREMYLPINVDIDQLPFIRPDPRPNTVMNHPPFIRMEAHSIAATGSRRARYRIPAHLIREPGCYRLSVRMRSRAEPIFFMKFVGATPEMIRSMNEGILDVHTFSKTFVVQ